MALIILVFVFILLKLVVELINSVVGQMHIQVVQIRILRCLVLLRCESSYSLLVNINSQRVHSVKKHVNSEVEFKIVHQIGLVKVLLDNTALVIARSHDVFHSP